MGEVKIDISDLDDEIGVSIIKSWFESNTQNILGDKGSPWRKFCAFIGGQIFPDLDSINDLPTAYHKCVTLSPRLPDEAGTGVWIEGDLAERLKSALHNSYRMLKTLDNPYSAKIARDAYNLLLAQLSDTVKATEEQVSLGECVFLENDGKPSPNDFYDRSCKKSGHKWSDSDAKNRCIWCGATPPTATNSESEKFFRHLNNGEVVLFPENVTQITASGGNMIEKGFRITITEKGLPA